MSRNVRVSTKVEEKEDLKAEALIFDPLVAHLLEEEPNLLEENRYPMSTRGDTDDDHLEWDDVERYCDRLDQCQLDLSWLGLPPTTRRSTPPTYGGD